MSVKDWFRSGEVEKLDAIGDINWLKETGFWSMVGKRIEKLKVDIHQDLGREGNDRDTDMFYKGQLRGVQRTIKEINKIKDGLQGNRSG